MTKLDQLPSEILSLIVSYIRRWDLPSCALINKSFYREVMPLLWHTIDIKCIEKYIAFTTCLIQSPHGHHVRSLSFYNVLEWAAEPSLLEHVQDVPNWDSLGTGNIIANLQHIPRYCPHLTSLEMWYARRPDPIDRRIAQATIASVGHYCKQLTKLVLRKWSYSIVDDLFGALKDAPLTDIQLFLYFRYTAEVARRFLDTSPLALHRYPLTTLTIEAPYDMTSFITTINTHGLTWPHLTTFKLGRCHSLTDAMILLFVQAHPMIECLKLGFGKLTDAFLDGLVDSLPNLTVLDVPWTRTITAPGICRLIKNYDGRLDGVHCKGCRIYPVDVPNDKTYDYRLKSCDHRSDENPEVEWFFGTFYDNGDSKDTQDDDDQP